MRSIVFSVVVLFLFSCNTKYNIIDTGLANGKFAGNMYEYLQSNHYDWDSTVLMIKKADLVDLFEGKRAGYEKITFFGPSNHSIRKYMLDNGYTCVDEMGEELCYEMIMKCVVKGKYMREDIPAGKPVVNTDTDDEWNDKLSENPDVYCGEGGVIFTGEMGNRFWIYSFQESYEKVPGVGAVVLYIVSLETGGTQIDVASTNIEPTNGVVHSLHYNFVLGNL